MGTGRAITRSSTRKKNSPTEELENMTPAKLNDVESNLQVKVPTRGSKRKLALGEEAEEPTDKKPKTESAECLRTDLRVNTDSGDELRTRASRVSPKAGVKSAVSTESKGVEGKPSPKGKNPPSVLARTGGGVGGGKGSKPSPTPQVADVDVMGITNEDHNYLGAGKRSSTRHTGREPARTNTDHSSSRAGPREEASKETGTPTEGR